MNGWVKIHRSFLDWEWADDPNMVALFLRLILLASFEDKEWHGIVIKRGQAVVGRKSLAEQTGISERTIRTCLSRLESTGEITRKATNKYTIITISKYDGYQLIFDDDDQQVTSNRPTSDQQPTTSKEIKNIRNIPVCDARARLEELTINNSGWLDQTAMSLHTPDVLQVAMDVMTEWELTHIPADEWTPGHLFNHMRVKLAIRKSEDRRTDKVELKEARRAELKRKILEDLKVS